LSTLLRTLAAAALAAAAFGAAGEGAAKRYVKDGLVIEFSATPAGPGAAGLVEDELAELRFRITEEASGRPVRGLAPGAWLDIGEIIQGKPGSEQKSCKDKIALYLKGVVGMRPMVDMNSYHVVTLNREASLSVIDPKVSMAGSTSTLARVALARPGADLAQSADDKRLFVSMPAAGQVAVIETGAFKVVANIATAAGATRLALQPDGRYLWVGNNAPGDDKGSVTVIDTERLAAVATLAVGRGHHELAFSDDSRWAFVSNRGDGSVSVIDVRQLAVVRELELGGQPISLAYSRLAQALYVADALRGIVHVIRPATLETIGRIATRPGLGPMRATRDGRWLFALNTSEDRVLVIDPSSHAIRHEIAVQGQPYQIAFTRAFAYVRALGSERVTMVNLTSLGEGRKPIVQSFAAGSVPPKAAGDLLIADSIAPAAGDAGVLVVNPGDSTTYFYMEGMNAAASNYKVAGSSARAVAVVDRSLREAEPGVYVSRLTMPAAGRFDVAFSLDTPRMLHCFSTEAAVNPRLAAARKGIQLDYLVGSNTVAVGEKLRLRLRIVDAATRTPRTGLGDLQVMSMLAPGRRRAVTSARELGAGLYEAEVSFGEPGAYYVYAASRTLGKGFEELPFLTLRALAQRGVAEQKPTP
jgi:YVTN family beta-propeller protein